MPGRAAPPRWGFVALVAGVGGYLAQVVDRVVTGSTGDATLVYASLGFAAVGLGLSIDWIRGK